MRGEYGVPPSRFSLLRELPPRARRIPGTGHQQAVRTGTTSACAENTNQGLGHGYRGWNYLRVRGEYISSTTNPVPLVELPPRARRIRLLTNFCMLVHGTTSACAENTVDGFTQFTEDWNYLRVRGEYILIISGSSVAWELPPRARRIQSSAATAWVSTGTTSACAENTLG